MNRNPDVVLFIRWLRGGGAERVIANLANGLAERNLKVDLVLMQAEGEYLETLHSNVRVVNLDTQSASAGRGWRPPTSFQSTGSLLKLVRYLKQYRPPVLLSATHYLNEIALLAKQLAQVPTRVIVTEHTHLSQEFRLTEQISSKLIPWTVRALYRFADEVVAVSQGVAADLDTFSPHRRKPTRVVYNSVVTPDIYRLAEAEVAHPWFQQKDLPIVIGSGRFVRQKDFPTLVRAFAHLRQTIPARLVLLGDGRDHAEILRLVEEFAIADHVWMPGFVSNPYAYMKKADVFALSSAWEGLPTVLIEAIALGVPVVSTDCPSGPAEILKQGRYGRLVPVGDAVTLGDAIASTLQEDSPSVPQDWIREFTPEVAIRKYIDVLGLSPVIPSSTVHMMGSSIAIS
ncbi:glycosyltransferase [Leptolyngbya sp. PCC 6406]|uniref:glycosyltransferase n=1 Tax=Leptolyngbya sp. PCC 6406 TaxID=1173264 RepID=UPI0002ABCF01|nr:glycosyltransferase [Leptolyngbya sp. PCC 6406]